MPAVFGRMQMNRRHEWQNEMETRSSRPRRKREERSPAQRFETCWSGVSDW